MNVTVDGLLIPVAAPPLPLANNVAAPTLAAASASRGTSSLVAAAQQPPAPRATPTTWLSTATASLGSLLPLGQGEQDDHRRAQFKPVVDGTRRKERAKEKQRNRKEAHLNRVRMQSPTQSEASASTGPREADGTERMIDDLTGQVFSDVQRRHELLSGIANDPRSAPLPDDDEDDLMEDEPETFWDYDNDGEP